MARAARGVAAAAAALALVACSGDGGGTDEDPAIEGVSVYQDLAHDHVQGDVTYDVSPPVGGPHSPVWLGCGVYTEAVPEENVVHSMEHGAVWLAYDPALTADDVQKLKNLHGLEPAYVVLSPYPGLPAKVVASTWGRQLKAESADDPRLAAFVKEYAGGDQGGEPGADCVRGATLEQLRSGSAPSMG